MFMLAITLLGQRVSQWDVLERETQYAYDDLGRLEQIDYPAPDADVSYTYTANQRKILTDGLGVTTWAYDDLGRALAITDPFDNTVGYGYDGQGNRTRLTYADEKEVQNVYDSLNRLQTVIDWDNRETGYT